MSVRILTGMCILFKYRVDIPLCLASKYIKRGQSAVCILHDVLSFPSHQVFQHGANYLSPTAVSGFNSFRHPGPFLTLEWSSPLYHVLRH